MLSYLQNTLGLSALEYPWNDLKRLPQYLRNNRQYSILDIDGVKFLLIRLTADTFQIAAYLKQFDKLQEYWNGDVILCFAKLSSYQRKALIEQRISFVVPDSQLYLPNIGLVLQERIPSIPTKKTKFSAAAQYVLLYLLYRQDDSSLSKVELSKHLDVSAMHVTRSVQELSSLGFVSVTKTGRSDYVSLAYERKELFEKIRPYLIDPIQKRMYVKESDVWIDLPLSGESALAKRTMLNMPRIICKAIDRKLFKTISNAEPVDPAWRSDMDYIELEVWKYDPCRLAQDGMVDIVSLAASMESHEDDRIALALEEMMEAYKW